MGTKRVRMKEVVLRWARRACTRDFYPALAALVSPIQPHRTTFFPHRTLFQFVCPHRPATWVGSRAGPPVSECVSPVKIEKIFLLRPRIQMWIHYIQLFLPPPPFLCHFLSLFHHGCRAFLSYHSFLIFTSGPLSFKRSSS